MPKERTPRRPARISPHAVRVLLRRQTKRGIIYQHYWVVPTAYAARKACKVAKQVANHFRERGLATWQEFRNYVKNATGNNREALETLDKMNKHAKDFANAVLANDRKGAFDALNAMTVEWRTGKKGTELAKQVAAWVGGLGAQYVREGHVSFPSGSDGTLSTVMNLSQLRDVSDAWISATRAEAASTIAALRWSDGKYATVEDMNEQLRKIAPSLRPTTIAPMTEIGQAPVGKSTNDVAAFYYQFFRLFADDPEGREQANRERLYDAARMACAISAASLYNACNEYEQNYAQYMRHEQAVCDALQHVGTAFTLSRRDIEAVPVEHEDLRKELEETVQLNKEFFAMLRRHGIADTRVSKGKVTCRLNLQRLLEWISSDLSGTRLAAVTALVAHNHRVASKALEVLPQDKRTEQLRGKLNAVASACKAVGSLFASSPQGQEGEERLPRLAEFLHSYARARLAWRTAVSVSLALSLSRFVHSHALRLRREKEDVDTSAQRRALRNLLGLVMLLNYDASNSQQHAQALRMTTVTASSVFSQPAREDEISHMDRAAEYLKQAAELAGIRQESLKRSLKAVREQHMRRDESAWSQFVGNASVPVYQFIAWAAEHCGFTPTTIRKGGEARKECSDMFHRLAGGDLYRGIVQLYAGEPQSAGEVDTRDLAPLWDKAQRGELKTDSIRKMLHSADAVHKIALNRWITARGGRTGGEEEGGKTTYEGVLQQVAQEVWGGSLALSPTTVRRFRESFTSLKNSIGDVTRIALPYITAVLREMVQPGSADEATVDAFDAIVEHVLHMADIASGKLEAQMPTAIALWTQTTRLYLQNSMPRAGILTREPLALAAQVGTAHLLGVATLALGDLLRGKQGGKSPSGVERLREPSLELAGAMPLPSAHTLYERLRRIKEHFGWTSDKLLEHMDEISALYTPTSLIHEPEEERKKQQRKVKRHPQEAMRQLYERMVTLANGTILPPEERREEDVIQDELRSGVDRGLLVIERRKTGDKWHAYDAHWDRLVAFGVGEGGQPQLSFTTTPVSVRTVFEIFTGASMKEEIGKGVTVPFVHGAYYLFRQQYMRMLQEGERNAYGIPLLLSGIFHLPAGFTSTWYTRSMQCVGQLAMAATEEVEETLKSVNIDERTKRTLQRANKAFRTLVSGMVGEQRWQVSAQLEGAATLFGLHCAIEGLLNAKVSKGADGKLTVGLTESCGALGDKSQVTRTAVDYNHFAGTATFLRDLFLVCASCVNSEPEVTGKRRKAAGNPTIVGALVAPYIPHTLLVQAAQHMTYSVAQYRLTGRAATKRAAGGQVAQQG